MMTSHSAWSEPVGAATVSTRPGGTLAVRPPTVSADALADALRTEARLLGELSQVLRDQREGIAAEDMESVNDSIHAVHRLLLTLGEARLRRRTLVQVLTGREDVPLSELVEALGDAATDAVTAARDEVRAVAAELVRDLSLNRRILDRAIQAGEAHVRVLSGMPKRHLTYPGRGISGLAARARRSLIDEQV
ncbi:MAG TPA: flagellar export chaperone FlgN [Longimicrobiales bacterium]|nr:flagellar export chaperone FlgN [Longimicrobiales bacterium]